MEHLPNYERQDRPWGNFERFTVNEPSTVKVITVSPDQALSLQSHERRDEFWKIINGSGVVTLKDEKLPATSGDTFWIERETKHRIESGEHGICFVEVAFGEFDENDIRRYEDRYGR